MFRMFEIDSTKDGIIGIIGTIYSFFGGIFISCMVLLVFIWKVIDDRFVVRNLGKKLDKIGVSIFWDYTCCECKTLKSFECDPSSICEIMIELLMHIFILISCLLCCLLFSIFFGFNSSIGLHLYKTYNKNKHELYFIRVTEREKIVKNLHIYFFSNKWKKLFESVFGETYLNSMSNSKDKMLRICCLHHCLGQAQANSYPWVKDDVPERRSSTVRKYLSDKRVYCFAGVTFESIENNVCIIWWM